MARLIVSLAFAMFLAQATGAHAFFLAGECREDCRDDQSDGRCAPSCADCTCCAHLRPASLSGPASVSAPAPCWMPIGDVRGALLSSEPREIMHVPILLPAFTV